MKFNNQVKIKLTGDTRFAVRHPAKIGSSAHRKNLSPPVILGMILMDI